MNTVTKTMRSRQEEALPNHNRSLNEMMQTSFKKWSILSSRPILKLRLMKIASKKWLPYGLCER